MQSLIKQAKIIFINLVSSVVTQGVELPQESWKPVLCRLDFEWFPAMLCVIETGLYSFHKFKVSVIKSIFKKLKPKVLQIFLEFFQ